MPEGAGGLGGAMLTTNCVASLHATVQYNSLVCGWNDGPHDVRDRVTREGDGRAHMEFAFTLGVMGCCKYNLI